MHTLDWAVLFAYAAAAVLFGLWLARRPQGHASGEDYMVAGRRLPWWIIGVADVATYGGGDAFWVLVFFTGGFIGYYRFFWVSLAVALPLEVLWARYWRRLGLFSAGQLFEVRYSGTAAAHFRAFSSLYGGLFGLSLLVGYVLQSLAESLAPFLGWPGDLVLLFFCGATLIYTLVSGLLGVAYSDIGQFAFMMIGRVILCAVLLSAAGGLGAVLDRVVAVRGAAFLQPYPPTTLPPGAAHEMYGEFAVDPGSLLALLAFGLFGVGNTANPVIQKSLAAKNEVHAAAGQACNAVLSLLVRVVPVALIGLVAVATFPKGRTGTGIWADLVRAHARPGLLGLLLVGIVAGYLSCLDGVINFAAAGLLNDVYRRYLRPEATGREQVAFGRLATLGVLGLAFLWAKLLIGHVDGAWLNFVNSVIALFVLPLGLLRWTWWRLNIWGEVVGFVVSFPLAYAVWFGLGAVPAFKDRPYWQAFLVLFGLGWGAILLVTLSTPAEDMTVLRRFYEKARPPGFWGPVKRAAGAGGAVPTAHGWDLGSVICGLVFTLSSPVALCAGLSRRYGLLLALCPGIVVGAAGFLGCAVRSARVRGGG